jgi:hypothetical protein
MQEMPLPVRRQRHFLYAGNAVSRAQPNGLPFPVREKTSAEMYIRFGKKKYLCGVILFNNFKH